MLHAIYKSVICLQNSWAQLCIYLLMHKKRKSENGCYIGKFGEFESEEN